MAAGSESSPGSETVAPEPTSRLRSALADFGSRLASASTDEQIYLFFSVDLVNSTSLKNRAPARWPTVLSQFYEAVQREVRQDRQMRLWKYVGDEVLFFKAIASKNDLLSTVETLLYASSTLSQLIATHARTLLGADAPAISTKAGIWIASVALRPPASGSSEQLPRNLMVIAPRDDGPGLADFLGPEIDIGFRVCRYAWRGLLTVSAELARVLLHLDAERFGHRMRVAGYEKLKGVWNERYYPIIWLAESWAQPERLFEYDDRFAFPLVDRVFRADAMKPEELNRAFAAVGCLEANDALIAMLHRVEPHDAVRTLRPEATDQGMLEVHCVAVCFRDDGWVLVARRPEHKSLLPGRWEFGCAQLARGGDFFDAMLQHYRADFGATLEFPSRDPIGSYFIAEKGVPGVLFVARITNPGELEQQFVARKHTEIRWLDPRAPGLSDAETVPEFTTTLRKALQAWEGLKR